MRRSDRGSMGRREFVTLFLSATAWPLIARGAGKLPTIGYLGAGTSVVEAQRSAAFLLRLRELGWIEDRTVAIETRWAEGRRERADEIASEFARLKVDVVVTAGAANILAAKRALPETPIVFAVTADPVGAGLVASLARPGGMITGLSSQGADYGGKQIELLREIVPHLHYIGVIANAGSPGPLSEMHAFEATARTLGFELSIVEIHTPDDIAPAFEKLKGRVDAINVVPDPFTISNRLRFTALAVAARIPAIYGTREYPEVGGLMSFGPNLTDLYRRAAELIDKILRGTKPADIPVEQPTKFELVINLTTARSLGLSIPESFLLRADKVIE
jgi:putative tryptophan/tyrosine transport system substrate-binding protein